MAETLELATFFPYRCNKLTERISLSLSRIYVERFGISVAEWRVLATLGERRQMQARDIARHTNMDKVRVSRAVRQLTDRGLLLREVLANDNRAALLRLSAAGQRLYRRIVPEALAWEQSLLQPLSARERDLLDKVLLKLDARLDQLGE
jgi:DNA-binding MarR family transcriptional regulator